MLHKPNPNHTNWHITLYTQKFTCTWIYPYRGKRRRWRRMTAMEGNDGTQQNDSDDEVKMAATVGSTTAITWMTMEVEWLTTATTKWKWRRLLDLQQQQREWRWRLSDYAWGGRSIYGFQSGSQSLLVWTNEMGKKSGSQTVSKGFKYTGILAIPGSFYP